ncbi:MAG: phosphonate ABC transporter ATP-binding protein, partial [Candidatus Endolissoclinum sp. TMED55]
MLSALKVNKFFGSVHAVNEVSMSMETPQMIGIIGRSGAGKSTFLRILNRLTDATTGSVVVDGDDVLTFNGQRKRKWQ